MNQVQNRNKKQPGRLKQRNSRKKYNVGKNMRYGENRMLGIEMQMIGCGYEQEAISMWKQNRVVMAVEPAE